MSWSGPEVLGEIEELSGVELACADVSDVECACADDPDVECAAEENAGADDPDVEEVGNVDDALSDVRSPKSGVGQYW